MDEREKSPLCDEDDSSICSDEPEKKTKFRINSKKLFITYPQCGDLTKETVLKKIREFGHVVQYVVAREEHQEDGWHVHAAFEYSHKINWTDPRKLDIDGHHCNIQSMKSWNQAKPYCMKDGDFITGNVFDDSSPEKFVGRKADYDAWTNHHHKKARGDLVYPIVLPDGDAWTPQGKKRHLWIIGPPDWGKSTWAFNTFDEKKVFIRSECPYPFEGYLGESVILYDDVWPKAEEWLSVSNIHFNDMHVYGPTRYKGTFWPNKIDLTMIVLSNNDPYYTNMDAFNARFIVLRL
nr:MAG: replication associated protein [Cressdnaviricota sp.]